MSMLETLAPGLHVCAAPMSFFGLRVGTRMTVVELEGGGLLLHSPVPVTPELRQAVDAVGEVAHIVAPNIGHHVYVGDWKAAYPKATLHAPKSLEPRRKDIVIERYLDDDPAAAFGEDFEVRHVDGCLIDETVFLHRATGTLINADLIENFETSPHLPTRLYLKATGIHGRPGLSRALWPTFRDKKAARRAIDDILEWDFDRVCLTHGDVIEAGGKPLVRDTYTWLR